MMDNQDEIVKLRNLFDSLGEPKNVREEALFYVVLRLLRMTNDSMIKLILENKKLKAKIHNRIEPSAN